MKDIENKYGTQHINFVGHSQGGLVALNYAEQHINDVHVDKLVTLDTPFGGGLFDVVPGNDLRRGYPNVQLGIAKDNVMTYNEEHTYEAARSKAQTALQNAQVWSVYGSSDMAVGKNSAMALGNLDLPNFSTTIYSGLGHSDVHEDSQVINDVNYFLFKGVHN